MSLLEQELKLVAENADVLEAILQSELVKQAGTCEGTHGPERFHAIYYDTPALELEKKRHSLLPESDLKREVLKILTLRSSLVPRVEVNMQRTIRMLESEGSHFELVADRGVIKGTHGECVLHELELELKRGEVEPVLRLGKQIADAFGLTPSHKTKHEIGLSLCQ
ncbi:MAG: hypothetical protein P8Y12_03540 [Gammaproteobacteria bacterium]